MMRMTHKLAFTTACLAIFFTVVVKPASATDNSLSGQLIAQSFNEETFVKETPQTPDSSKKADLPDSQAKTSNDSFLTSFLWGLGGYLVGSLVGTNKTYTKMNKGR